MKSNQYGEIIQRVLNRFPRAPRYEISDVFYESYPAYDPCYVECKAISNTRSLDFHVCLDGENGVEIYHLETQCLYAGYWEDLEANLGVQGSHSRPPSMLPGIAQLMEAMYAAFQEVPHAS